MLAADTSGTLREIVVCSLEAWDDVWRRNQFLVDSLLRRNSSLRVLFVEPPADVLFDLSRRRLPARPRLRVVSDDRRLRALRPLKALPRRLGSFSDDLLLHQVRLAVRRLGFARPTLWINDVTYAPLIRSTGWPALYDITDDWLLAPFAARELERLRRLDKLALEQADEVVVCSEALAVSRSETRATTLIPNGVDVGHFRRPQPRPHDLPEPPVAVYVGSLHDARIDVELVEEVARALPHGNVVLVGPDSLGNRSRRRLAETSNVVFLGARPYRVVPAYLQHADVVIVPHRVSPFTQSLDPIKAYECLAIDTPTVATPVAGFRDHADSFSVVRAADFAGRVAEILCDPPFVSGRSVPPDWEERALAFEGVLVRAAEQTDGTHARASGRADSSTCRS